jgi:hypothetical protein
MMSSFLESFRRAIGNTKIMVGSLIIYCVSQVIIMVIVSSLGSDMLGIQVTLSNDKFLAIARGWESSGLTGVYYRHFYLDYIHPIIYGIFLSSFMAKAFDRRNIPGKLNILLLLPFLAAAFDLIENSMHLYLLADLSRVTRGAVMFSGICTNLKWTIAFMCLFGSAALFFSPRKKAPSAE